MQTCIKNYSVSTQTFAPLNAPVPEVRMCSLVTVIKDNDSKAVFYTGLSWDLIQHVLKFVEQQVPRKQMARSNLLSEDEVMMRLRLNLILDDLAIRFSVTKTTVGSVFQKWVDTIFVRLKFLFKGPSKDVICGNLPKLFKEL